MFLSILLIFLCFFLTSTGYLAWLYHLLAIAPAMAPELLAMCFGYAAQAAGIGIFSVLLYRRPELISYRTFSAALAAYIFFMIPSVLAEALLASAVFGLLANLFCGVIAGYYLYHLSRSAAPHLALIFGAGYGASVFASWILSLIGSGEIYRTNAVILICIALALLTAALLWFSNSRESSLNKNITLQEPVSKCNNTAAGCNDPVIEPAANNPGSSGRTASSSFHMSRELLAGCAVVFLFSVVNHIGFSFPSADLADGVNLELTRLFYAAGLVIAGVVSDKDRKHGAVLTLGALVIPFIMLTLRNEVVPVTVLWALSYFASGFFSIYRVILFVDLARRQGSYSPAERSTADGSADSRGPYSLTEKTAAGNLADSRGPYSLTERTAAGNLADSRGPYSLTEKTAADSRGSYWLAGFGLLFGRLGEALGTVICYAAAGRTIMLVAAASLLYAATIFLFFWLFQRLYLPEADSEKKARERFLRFSTQHDLSPREREILLMLLAKETTPNIAGKLFITESTVKFHVHNILQKTGCKNRKELSERFCSGQ